MLRPAPPAVSVPAGAAIHELPVREIAAVPIGGRTLLFSCADYMVRRQLVVREVVHGEALVRAQLLPAEPDPGQPDGDRYLHASFPNAFWIDGDVVHFVLSKQLF